MTMYCNGWWHAKGADALRQPSQMRFCTFALLSIAQGPLTGHHTCQALARHETVEDL